MSVSVTRLAPSGRSRTGGNLRFRILALLPAALFFAAVAPTLTWCEFSGGMENFNLETALEMTRDGHWIVPTLDGLVRTKKPPLAEWITAWGILSSSSLPWGARWPSLLCAALTLVAAYELGRLIGGFRLGFITACLCGSSYLFLKFAREASYDIQLAFWVTVCNVFLARLILRRQWWIGCIGAGAALGLALMTKGPPAILETIVPVLALVLWERYERADAAERSDSFRVAPILVGTAICLAIALPWTIDMMRLHSGRMAEWYREVALAEEARFERRWTVWFTYLGFVLWIVPWTVWFLVGVVRAVSRRNSVGRAIRLMLAWVFVPLIVMWFFPERRDRYVLPMIPPAAVIAAWAMIESFADSERRILLPVLHWLTVGAVGIGLAAIGAIGVGSFQTLHHRPWFSPASAAGLILVTLILLFLSVRPGRASPIRMALGTLAIMLVAQTAFTWGYSRSLKGRSEARPFVDQVERAEPNAILYNAVNRDRRQDLPLEMTIYFNQVVPRCGDPRRLKPAGRPQVIIFPDGAETAPPDFVRVARSWIKGEWWNAFARPAAD